MHTRTINEIILIYAAVTTDGKDPDFRWHPLPSQVAIIFGGCNRRPTGIRL